MTNVEGDPEEERKADFYQKDWLKEGVCRYFYAKVQQRRAELERDLGVRQLGGGSTATSSNNWEGDIDIIIYVPEFVNWYGDQFALFKLFSTLSKNW